jgi:hypothetical protein
MTKNPNLTHEIQVLNRTTREIAEVIFGTFPNIDEAKAYAVSVVNHDYPDPVFVYRVIPLPQEEDVEGPDCEDVSRPLCECGCLTRFSTWDAYVAAEYDTTTRDFIRPQCLKPGHHVVKTGKDYLIVTQLPQAQALTIGDYVNDAGEDPILAQAPGPRLNSTFQDYSLSHGTMVVRDLRNAFEGFIIFLASSDPITFADTINAMDLGLLNYREEDLDAYVFETLWEALDRIAPEGCYFGTHPGDGSDYGFWTADDKYNDVDYGI